MSEDIRMALGAPRTVPTALGPIEVRTLSALEFIGLTDQIVGISKLVSEEARIDSDAFNALQRVLQKKPHLFLGLLQSATKRTAEELGGLPLDDFFDVIDAFVEQHEKSIARFFVLKDRIESQWARATAVANSRSSSTRSSPAGGPSPISEPSASSNSNAIPGSPQSEHSPTVFR